MQATFKSDQFTDADGNPAGGITSGTGFTIAWQNGPLREQGSDEPAEPNGAFVETIIAAAADRLEFYQASKFKSDYNAKALDALEAALSVLNQRTQDRLAREVEGTHKV